MAASERLLRRILNPGDDLRHYVREIVVLAVGRLSDQFPLLLLEEAVTKIGRLHVFRCVTKWAFVVVRKLFICVSGPSRPIQLYKLRE